MRSKFKKALTVSALSVASIALFDLAGPLPASTATFKNDPRYGGTLRLGHYLPPTLVNPILTDHSVSAIAVPLIFNSLLRGNEHGEIENDLAESWDISKDGKVYSFRLKRGIRFHDDVELTAVDVAFTYKKILDPVTASPYAAYLSMVERVEEIGRYEFRIHLKEATPFFELQLIRGILPKHVYGAEDMRRNKFNFKPIGTGPFIMKEWSNSELVLEANEDYHEGRPFLDSIVFKIFPDAAAYWSAFMRDEIDLIFLMNATDFKTTHKDPTFETFTHPTVNYYGVFYDLNDPELSDIRVRQAIAHAINVPELIRVVEDGYGTPSYGPFSEGSFGFDPSVRPVSYDAKKTLTLLKETGKEAPHLRLLVEEKDGKAIRIAKLIRQQLSEAGIRVSIILYKDYNQLQESRFLANSHLRMEYAGRMNPASVVKSWHSDQQRQGKLWQTGSLSVQLDPMINDARNCIDIDRRTELYQKIHRFIYQNQLATFLYFEHGYHAVNRRVRDAGHILNALMPGHNYRKVYLREDND